MVAFLKRAWRPATEHRVLLVGNQGSGKTIFLNDLKLNGEHITTPSHDSNLKAEVVEYPKGCTWMISEVEGLDDAPDLARKRLSPDTLVIHLHDCHDPAPMVPSFFPSFIQGMADRQCRNIWIAFNKQDKDGIHGLADSKIEELKEVYEQELFKYKDSISWRFLTHILIPKSSVGTFSVLEDMFLTMKSKPMNSLSSIFRLCGEKPGPPKPDVANQLVVEYEIAQDPLDGETFWSLIAQRKIIQLSHYNFLRVAYTLAVTFRPRVDSVLDGTFDIAGQLVNSYASHLGMEYGETMRVFWTVHVRDAIRNYRLHMKLNGTPSLHDFHLFLRNHHYLMNPELWQAYYTKELYFSPDAKRIWLPPDLRPLPWVSLETSNEVLINACIEDEDRMFRYAFSVVQFVHRVGKQQHGTIVTALESLRRSTIRLREINPSILSYSETQAYFWFQVVYAAFRALSATSIACGDTKSNPSIPTTSRLTFAGLKELFNVDSSFWSEFYSEKVWHGILNRTSFRSPDLRPLSHLRTRFQISAEQDAALGSTTRLTYNQPPLPHFDELAFRATLILEETADLPEPGPLVNSHAHLLHYLYRHLVAPDIGNATHEETPDYSSIRGNRAKSMWLEISGPPVDSLTHRNFWIQQFLLAIEEEQQKKKPRSSSLPQGLQTFENFITAQLHLVNEDLPSLYYSPEVWDSQLAPEKIIPPDRKPIGGSLDLSKPSHDGVSGGGEVGKPQAPEMSVDTAGWDDWVHV